MALTRKMLKAMGIEDDKVDQIIEAHTETVSGLKDSLAEAKDKADGYDKMKADLEKAQSDLEAVRNDGWKDKYDKLDKEFKDFKAEQTSKATRTAKETAVRSYLESKGIKGTNLAIAMRGLNAEIEAVELDGEKVKDTKALDDLIAGDFSALVGKEEKAGANTSTPPANNGGKTTMTKDEIMNIKDTAARQKAIAENPGLFGIQL